MKKTPTSTIEDYLGIIYTLQRDGEEVIGARLAEILQVSAPTVTTTLKRMLRDGWITINQKKNISLTRAGYEAARSVIRRHMLTEWLLSRVLHIPLSELHDEAHKIEHTISPQVEQQLIASMDHPEVCPHGNPLPGQENASVRWQPLTSFSSGEVITIRRIHELLEEDHETMALLEKAGIHPGISVKVDHKDESKKILNIDFNKRSIQLSFAIAEKMYAESPAENN